jgi:hypothetical protein
MTTAAELGITIRPVGGLGNQLFVYATGLAAAERLRCPLYVLDGWYSSQSLRVFELDSIRCRGQIVHQMDARNPRRRPSSLSLLSRQRRLFRERTFAYDPSFAQVSVGTELQGYFQSWRYFDQYREAIRSDVSEIQSPTDWFHETRAALDRLGSWAAVHIRRGDYLNPGPKEVHGIAGADYYHRALEIVDSRLGDLPIVAFSDEPDEARAVLASLGRTCTVVNPPEESRPVESVNLLSGATAAVIANSSFSWWGAWLGEPSTQLVVAPRPWFDDPTIVDRDLLPVNWVSVGR